MGSNIWCLSRIDRNLLTHIANGNGANFTDADAQPRRYQQVIDTNGALLQIKGINLFQKLSHFGEPDFPCRK
jgi:hypothetical protein